MIENHMRAERAILSSRRRRVNCTNVPIDGWPRIHRPERPTDRRGIAAARSDQQIAVSQPKHKAVGCAIAIEIGPEHDISCGIDCLHRITGECQAKAFAAIDGIEENDYFPPISRRSCEPTRVESLGSGTVVRKESNLSSVVN
jgi:hypothetical protein